MLQKTFVPIAGKRRRLFIAGPATVKYDVSMSFLEKMIKSVFRRLIKKGVDDVFRDPSKKQKKDENPPAAPDNQEANKNHPWRLCPVGHHWVRTHPLTVPASGEGPERETIRHGHCRVSFGKSEVYTADELREIAESHFDKLTGDIGSMPIPDSLGFPNGNDYDHLIAGWTKFWNEILKPKVPLTPDFVKSLIATESSFEIPKDMKSKVLMDQREASSRSLRIRERFFRIQKAN